MTFVTQRIPIPLRQYPPKRLDPIVVELCQKGFVRVVRNQLETSPKPKHSSKQSVYVVQSVI